MMLKLKYIHYSKLFKQVKEGKQFSKGMALMYRKVRAGARVIFNPDDCLVLHDLQRRQWGLQGTRTVWPDIFPLRNYIYVKYAGLGGLLGWASDGLVTRRMRIRHPPGQQVIMKYFLRSISLPLI